MKVQLLVIFIVITFNNLQSQEDYFPEDKVQEINQKKARLKDMDKEEVAAYKLTRSLLEKRKFVLEADYLSGRSGSRTPVTSTFNFIIIDSVECTIQIGSNSGIGSNGVGGVTAEGHISRYEITENEKNGNFTLKLIANTANGIYDITFFVNPLVGAEAEIRGNYSGMLRYSGQIIPISKSSIYKGHSY